MTTMNDDMSAVLELLKDAKAILSQYGCMFTETTATAIDAQIGRIETAQNNGAFDQLEG